MDKKEEKKVAEKESKEKFNSVTRKTKPENQNQTHNSKKEGLGPLNKKF